MKPIVLCIMDGVGIREEEHGNAFLKANKPNFDCFWNNFPHNLLHASEEYVGLPKGQMGNSEVGHLNIGAGRIVYQSLELINRSIRDNSLFEKEEFIKMLDYAKKNNSKIHIMGLYSDGGVHSSMDHFNQMFKYLNDLNYKTYLHMITDGRDTGQYEFLEYLKKSDKDIYNSIASIGGRYYAMDRDNREVRTNLYYDTLTSNVNDKKDPIEVVSSSYDNEATDEFIKPILLNNEGMISKNDVIIWINFRPDRARQIVKKIVDNNIYILTMMEIADTIKCPHLLSSIHIDDPLGEFLSNNGLKQLRIAETEKYAHVTYFFDGGDEKSYPGCDRVLIPSPSVATYDLKPEMSCNEVTDKLINLLDNNYDFVLVNYANCDMVGHTGSMDATIKAVEAVDNCLGRLYKKVNELGGLLLITADHGNSDYMLDKDNNVVTSHSLSLVPLIITNKDYEVLPGNLSDIAPSILKIMNLHNDKMTGNIIIKSINK